MSSKNKLKKTHSNSRECDICISLVGPVGCGKSALLVKYITKRFIGEYDPTYEGCWTKCESCDGVDVNVQVMDTYDKERKNLEKYLKWSDVMILVYSVTCYDSFTAIQEYLEQIYDIKKNSDDIEKVEKPPLKIILLGNKIDIERHRQVNKQDVDNLVEKYLNNNSKPPSADISTSTISNDSSVCLNLTHLESTSCEEYELVQHMFQKIIREIRSQREAFQLSNPLQIIEETSHKNQKSKMNNSINKNRTKSPKHNVAETSMSSAMINANGNMSPILSNVNNSNLSNLSILPQNKDGSLKKNKFPFLNKILNKS